MKKTTGLVKPKKKNESLKVPVQKTLPVQKTPPVQKTLPIEEPVPLRGTQPALPVPVLPPQTPNKLIFADRQISTMTAMCYINCTFNLENIYKRLAVENVTETNLKKITTEYGKIYQLTPPNPDLGPVRGIPSKKRLFRNQSSVKIFTTKFVTIKIFATGKLHMTGCKTFDQQHEAILALFKQFKKIDRKYPNETSFTLDPGETCIKCIIDVVMNNIDYTLDFNIDIKKLDMLLQKDDTEFFTFYESPVNTSVNIKLTFPDPPHKKWPQITIDPSGKSTVETVTECPKIKKQATYTHSFLVFNSSKVIQSGRFYETEMEPAFNKFNEYIAKNKHKLELNLTKDTFDVSSLAGIGANAFVNGIIGGSSEN